MFHFCLDQLLAAHDLSSDCLCEFFLYILKGKALRISKGKSLSLRWVGRSGWCRMKQVFSGVLREMAHKLWRVCVRRSIQPLLSTETCLWSTLPTCCCTTACMTRPMSCCNRPCRSTAQRYALTLTYNADRWTAHCFSVQTTQFTLEVITSMSDMPLTWTPMEYSSDAVEKHTVGLTRAVN